jgi:hypothetical protein
MDPQKILGRGEFSQIRLLLPRNMPVLLRFSLHYSGPALVVRSSDVTPAVLE